MKIYKMKVLLKSKENIELLTSTASKLLKLKNIFFDDFEILNSVQNKINLISENDLPKNSTQFLETNSIILTKAMKELEEYFIKRRNDFELLEPEDVFRSTSRAEVSINERSLDVRSTLFEHNAP